MSSSPAFHQNTNGAGKRSKRGTIQAFSRQAQSRFKSLFRKIDFLLFAALEAYSSHSRGFLLTVRCNHGEQPTKAQFQQMKEKLRRVLLAQFGPQFGVIWKAERQRTNSTLHLHIVILAPDLHSREKVSNWVKMSWGKIIGSDCPDTNVKCLYNDCSSLARYLSKQPTPFGMEWNFGKCYGTWGKLPFSQPDVLDISEEHRYSITVAVVKEYLPDNRKAEKFSENWKGISFDGLTPGQIKQIKTEIIRKINELENLWN